MLRPLFFDKPICFFPIKTPLKLTALLFTSCAKKSERLLLFSLHLINVNYRKDCVFKLNFMTKSV